MKRYVIYYEIAVEGEIQLSAIMDKSEKFFSVDFNDIEYAIGSPVQLNFIVLGEL